jgi:Tfp pilus assembly protein PilO
MENNNLSPDVANTRKRARITAFALAAAVIVCLMFMMYAFVQKSEADKQRAIAAEQSNLATQYQKLVGDLDNHQQATIAELKNEIDSLKRISCK